MKMSIKSLFVIPAIASITLFTSCSSLNTNGDPHFTEDGYLIVTNTNKTKADTVLTKAKFYVEVSGSMNGFFRANVPTRFKKDVWEICSYYSAISPDVTILTNDGTQGATIPLANFQSMMNTGAFISTASTRVPNMLQSIINDINPDKGEVAILISDMIYDPVGENGAKVLPTQYSSDISRILGTYNKSVCLVGAVSDYIDKNANVVSSRAPYYYFIIGDETAVTSMRDGISLLLKGNGDFVDNIESGFSYGAPKYSFGIPTNCVQFMDEPTFEQYDGDTCTIKLRVDITPYRWIMTDKEYFKNAFKADAIYGSNLYIGDVNINVKELENRELKRTAIAEVELKLVNMATDSEVIKWTLSLPDTDYTLFGEFCGSDSPSNPAKTYSLENLIKGMFYGGVINDTLPSNYILVSKNNS